MSNVPTLNLAEPGRFLKYRGSEYCVASRTSNRESPEYLERQWVLRGGPAGEHYLVKSEEKTPAGLVETWVLTAQIDLGDVLSADSATTVGRFDQDSMPAAPPRAVQYRENLYKLDGTSTVKAADDEGNIVPKITWDFYSEDRKRNLAIEIWKEPDKDYPEAYLGDVVQPGEIEVMDKKGSVGSFLGAGQRIGLKEIQSAGVGFLLFAFLLMSNGLPFDWYTALAVPAGLIILAFNDVAARRILMPAAILWGGVAAAGVFGTFLIPFHLLAPACAAASLVLARVFRANAPGEARRLAAYGVLPPLWVYSFMEYLVFAPGPHAAYQFLAAILLPLAAAGLAFALNMFMEGRDG